MAFNVQLPGNCRLSHQPWTKREFVSGVRSGIKDVSVLRLRHGITDQRHLHMYSFSQKLSFLSPSLCFQSDVFYPNAIAATANPPGPPTGCRGNQVGRDFPLEGRLPCPIPLVQYPTPVRPMLLDQGDICADPVLNWEKYAEKLKMAVLVKKWGSRKKGSKSGEQEEEEHGLSTIESEEENDEEEHEEASVVEDTNNPPTRKRTRDTVSLMQKIVKKRVKNSKDNKSLNQMKEELFQKSVKGKKTGEGKGVYSRTKIDLSYLKEKEKRKRAPNKTAPGSLSQHQVDVAKNIPPFRVEGTWNYAFGGRSGAACLKKKGEELVLFVGNRAKIRQIDLSRSPKGSMLSRRVGCIWEEEDESVPKNREKRYKHSKGEISTLGPLCDVVLELISVPKMDILGARRGKSVNIYGVEGEYPVLLESVSNINYGWFDGDHLNEYTKSGMKVTDPVLLGFDFNPYFCEEVITVDENMLVRICDFTKGETVQLYNLTKKHREFHPWPNYPNLRFINDASGIQFGHNGHIFFTWADSTVFLGDRRDNPRGRSPFTTMFDLRDSVTSRSWSDQIFFNDSELHLNEYMSSLKLSNKENYYYVGTNTRLFLMDLRVPGQPVLKMDHGLPVAAYIDTSMSDGYETVVAGSQRLCSLFSSITDHAHVKCYDRPDCSGVNPVLHCLPKHLPNSADFFETMCDSGYGPSWEADHQTAFAHNNAWTTGLAMIKSDRESRESRDPSGMFVFTANSLGDAFFQELEQKPIDKYRRTTCDDVKFRDFAQQWKDAMMSKNPLEHWKPSVNGYERKDYSMFMEACAHEVKKMNVRSKPFDARKPPEVIQRMVEKKQVPLHKQIQKLRPYKADVAQRCLDFWEYDDEPVENLLEIKQEPQYSDESETEVEFMKEVQKKPKVVDLREETSTKGGSDSSSESSTSDSDEKVQKKPKVVDLREETSNKRRSDSSSESSTSESDSDEEDTDTQVIYQDESDSKSNKGADSDSESNASETPTVVIGRRPPKLEQVRDGEDTMNEESYSLSQDMFADAFNNQSQPASSSQRPQFADEDDFVYSQPVFSQDLFAEDSVPRSSQRSTRSRGGKKSGF